MKAKRLTFEFDLSDGTTETRSVEIVLAEPGTIGDKLKWVGLASEASPVFTIDNFTFAFTPGGSSSVGLMLGTVSGTAVVDGFHWCLYGTNSRSNFLINSVTLTTTLLAIPDTGITEANEWRQLYFFEQGTDKTTIYHMDAYKRGTKMVVQMWKE